MHADGVSGEGNDAIGWIALDWRGEAMVFPCWEVNLRERACIVVRFLGGSEYRWCGGVGNFGSCRKEEGCEGKTEKGGQRPRVG
jgi:hypothetical protein